MKLTILYTGQARTAAGVERETVDVSAPRSVAEVLQILASKHESLRAVLLATDGKAHPSLMVFVNEEQTRTDARVDWKDGDQVMLVPPISGG